MRMAKYLTRTLPQRAAVVVLASAIGFPVWAQQPGMQAPPATASQVNLNTQAPQTSDQNLNSTTQVQPAKEGFWGHLNPFARKKWVKRQVDPINDQLNELDQVNARNAQQIKDVDARAQAGIRQAQSTAEAANQSAEAAGQQAQNASNTAGQASSEVAGIGNTVNGLDQYHQVTDFEVRFRPGTTVMTGQSKQKLDQLAASLTGREGYILEMDAQAPGHGSVGIQRSHRLAEAVERYLAVDHQIPIYRMHSVALGNMEIASNSGEENPSEESHRREYVRSRVVRVRLMENSLAAQDAASPQGAAPSNGPVQP